MRRIFYVWTMTLSLAATAQDEITKEKKAHYFFTFNSGMIGGDPGGMLTYTVNTIHGVALGKRWRTGLGIGIDSYSQIQTAPIFGSASYNLLAKKNALFIQVNYGGAHAWMQKQEGVASVTSLGGVMFNAMLGYRITSGKLHATVSAGYKFQNVTNQYIYWYDYRGLLGSPGYSEKIEQDIQRFVLTVGVGWK